MKFADRGQVCVEQPYVASMSFYLSVSLGNDLFVSKRLRKIDGLGPAVRW